MFILGSVSLGNKRHLEDHDKMFEITNQNLRVNRETNEHNEQMH